MASSSGFEFKETSRRSASGFLTASLQAGPSTKLKRKIKHSDNKIYIGSVLRTYKREDLQKKKRKMSLPFLGVIFAKQMTALCNIGDAGAHFPALVASKFGHEQQKI